MPPSQAQENWTAPPIRPKIQGNPGPCGNRNRGWHGAVCAHVHGYLLNQTFFGPVSVATGTGPALFKAGNRPAGAGRRVPAARQAVVSCGAPLKDLRRARRKKRWGQPCRAKVIPSPTRRLPGNDLHPPGWGAGGFRPQNCDPDEGVASRPRNSPFPKKPRTRSVRGLFISHGLCKRF